MFDSALPAESVRYESPSATVRKITWLDNHILGTSYSIFTPSTLAPTEFSVIPGGPTGIVFEEFVDRLPLVARSVVQRIRPDILVNRVLPAGWIRPGARYVATCFWIWLCVIDVISDDMNIIFDWDYLFVTLSKLFQQPYGDVAVQDAGDLVVTVFCSLVRASQVESFIEDFTSTKIEPWKSAFFREVHNAVNLVQERKSLKRRAGPLKDFAELFLVRLTGTDFLAKTLFPLALLASTREKLIYPVRPFMVLARASLGFEADLEKSGSDAATLWNTITRVEYDVKNLVNVQTDILGWIKDHADGNPDNLIEIYMKRYDMAPQDAFKRVLSSHNDLVSKLLDTRQRCEEEQHSWLHRSRTPTRTTKEVFDRISVYTGVSFGIGDALVQWFQISGLHRKDLANMAFPETLTRAKYDALRQQEEFENLMSLPDA